jgi:hypothetical protein
MVKTGKTGFIDEDTLLKTSCSSFVVSSFGFGM